MCSSLSEGCEDKALEKGRKKEEFAKLAKTGGSDCLVGELLEYGGYECISACTVSMVAEV